MPGGRSSSDLMGSSLGVLPVTWLWKIGTLCDVLVGSSCSGIRVSVAHKWQPGYSGRFMLAYTSIFATILV